MGLFALKLNNTEFMSGGRTDFQLWKVENSDTLMVLNPAARLLNGNRIILGNGPNKCWLFKTGAPAGGSISLLPLYSGGK